MQWIFLHLTLDLFKQEKKTPQEKPFFSSHGNILYFCFCEAYRDQEEYQAHMHAMEQRSRNAAKAKMRHRNHGEDCSLGKDAPRYAS